MKCRAWIAALTAALLATNAGLAENYDPEQYIITSYPATCESPAYTLYESRQDGTITVVDEGEPLGHTWAEGGTSRTCTVCGMVEEIEPVFDALPQVRLKAELTGIGKKERVTVPVEFISPELTFTCYASMTIQGHSTLDLDKKNYTVRLFDDEQLTRKHGVSFNGWQVEHKYILKAYRGDTTMIRDITCARLWGQIAATRENVPVRLTQASNYGAVNGFPVTVWLNDEFLGLYMMNLHKDNDLYVMTKNNTNAVMIANERTMDESFFRAEAVFEEDVSEWEVEFAGEDPTWAMEHFNELIRFVMNSDDETFRTQLHEYVDVDAAIDYLIFIWTLGLEENTAKDLVMLTYGDVWIPSVYDMQEGLGLRCEPEAFLPTIGAETDARTGSLLWDRLLQGFTDEILARYWVLRQEILSEENIIRTAKELWDRIPEAIRNMDLQTWPDRDVYTLTDIETFVHERLQCLDAALTVK